MPTSVESEIRARLEQFASELALLFQESAFSTVEAAFGGGAPKRRGPGRPAGAGRSKGPATKKGQKRDPRVLEALTERLGGFIAKNPGQRIEQIGKALGVATKELALPVKKLIGAKRVSTKGQKRATTYYPGGSRAAKRAPKAKAERKTAGKRGPRKTTAKRGRKAAATAAPTPQAAPDAAA